LKVVAALLAAGSGSRFGADKLQLPLKGRPLWRHSYDTFLAHPGVAAVGIVCAADMIDTYRQSAPDAAFVAAGGLTRPESARVALAQMPADTEIALLHDAARPFVSAKIITDVIDAVSRAGAAAPGIPVADTIRELGTGNLDRSRIVAMQTPQGAEHKLFVQAYNSNAIGELTDDLAVLEAAGITPEIVQGEQANFKVTTPEDLARALAHLGPPETRTGIGYDVHPFTDRERPLMLGGVHFPEGPALDGHSDADVLLHAITDALLGAASLGDIGQHFPNTDAEWKDKPSLIFLQQAGNLLKNAGWRMLNIDATVIAEFPKVMKRSEEIRSTVAAALQIEASRVSVKATTNERLGSIGRGEGIAAFAVATISEWR
jgi:2-C-methyl-D-erythritol 4-phosphate cytidylyltransferase/2-C-methyl-D-erythritol 2,4-cyclodiphosphate synthase